MKVLVIGGGGSEHAVVLKLSQSKHINKIYCCPGNAGISGLAECIDVSPSDFSTLIDFVKYEWIDFTIVCSKKLISKGIVNAFKRDGCRIFGPDKNAAELIESRAFSKNLMKLYRIPAPEFKVFTSYLYAQDYVRLKGAPVVIKTDGYITENSTLIVSTVEEALDVIRLIMEDRPFGDAGKRIIIEEKLKGESITFTILTDGKTIVPLTSLCKYTRLLDGDNGSHTSGMGAFSPVPDVTERIENIITENILKPVLRALNEEGIKYKGIFSVDLVINNEKPYICDVNYCIEDLEAQTVLPRLKTDFTDIILASIDEKLSNINMEWKKEASVCIVVSSEGYPGKYRENVVIKGLEKIKNAEDVFLFHNSTAYNNSDIVNTGGRVISLTATGNDIKDARTKAYDALENIHFEGMHYRKDIGV